MVPGRTVEGSPLRITCTLYSTSQPCFSCGSAGGSQMVGSHEGSAEASLSHAPSSPHANVL